MLPTVVPILLGAVFLIAVLVILIRTFTFSRKVQPVEQNPAYDLDIEQIAEHMAEVVRLETISHEDPDQVDRQPFAAFHQTVERFYPRVHQSLERELVNGFSLLYTWKGSRPELEPVLLMGHFDVVPADTASLAEWEHPPFSGEIAEGYIWGRGTLDNKNQVIGALEAVEKLLEEGYQPERTVFLAFGHDEEIGGLQGAAQIVALLQERDVRLAAVLDEGGMVVEGIVPGVDLPIALIATVEKGYLTLDLSAAAEPGHSSTPPPQTAIGILSSALARLEANPMPSNAAYIRDMYQWVGDSVPFVYRMALANLWLFGGIVRRMLEKNPKTNAIIRTTTAATMIWGGVKDNILPSEAQAKVNFRLLPGDSIEAVVRRVEHMIDDKRVRVTISGGDAWNASLASPTDSPAFFGLENTIRQNFSAVLLAPYLMTGATDSRHYTRICEHVYRFTPGNLALAELAGVHGTNERIAVDSLGRMVQFFMMLLRTWAAEEM